MKVELLSSLKNLNLEVKNSSHKLHAQNKDLLQYLRSVKNTINLNLDMIIQGYSRKIGILIDTELIGSEAELGETLKTLERDRSYFKLRDYLDNVKYGKIRKFLREKVKLLTNAISLDSIYANMQNYLNLIERQSSEILKGMHNIQLDSIKHIESAKQVDYRNITKTLESHQQRFFTQRRHTVDSDHTQPKVRNIDTVNSFIRRIESGRLNNMSIKNSQVGGSNLLKKSLLYGNGLQRSGYLKEGTEIIAKEGAFKFGLKGSLIGKGGLLGNNLISIANDNRNFKNSLIELEEIDIEESFYDDFDDEGDQEEEITENFELSKEKMIENVNELIANFNNEEFFKTSNKNTVNKYLTEFRDSGNEIIKDILVNFNKL